MLTEQEIESIQQQLPNMTFQERLDLAYKIAGQLELILIDWGNAMEFAREQKPQIDSFKERIQEALSEKSTIIPSGLAKEEVREFILQSAE